MFSLLHMVAESSGQAGAIRHGISRALLKADPEFRPVFEKSRIPDS